MIPTKDQIIENNLAEAIDQEHEYEYAGDSFHQNTVDTCLSQGYSEDEAMDAGGKFISLAEKAGLKFYKSGL
jgi:hypothetical protein